MILSLFEKDRRISYSTRSSLLEHASNYEINGLVWWSIFTSGNLMRGASKVRPIGVRLGLARKASGRACSRREAYRFRVPAIKILHGTVAGSAEKKKPTPADLVTGAACEHALGICVSRATRRDPSRRPRFLEKRWPTMLRQGERRLHRAISAGLEREKPRARTRWYACTWSPANWHE